MKRVSLGTVLCANQPPVQKDEIILKINKECYSPIFHWLANNKGIKVDIAINKSLSELLIKNKCDKTLDYLGAAVDNGTVELLGGLAYHPFSPLIIESRYGRDEIKRQNELNDLFHRKIFRGLWSPEGFYLPEFAYSDEVAKLVAEMKYKYTITNGTLYAEKNHKPQPFDRIVNSNGINLFFTSDWSREFAMNRPDKGDCDTKRLVHDMCYGMCSWFQEKKGYTVWGYDIETIGHHHKSYGTHTLDAIARGINETDMESVFLGDLLKMFPEKEHAEIFPGSQSTTKEDIYAGEYFPLWKHSKNKLHEKIFTLEDYAIEVINDSARISDSNIYRTARENIDKGLYSCKAWQANPLAGHFIPWIITKGIDSLMNGITGCYFILKNSDVKITVKRKELDAEEMIEKAKGIEREILKLVWKEQLCRQMD